MNGGETEGCTVVGVGVEVLVVGLGWGGGGVDNVEVRAER